MEISLADDARESLWILALLVLHSLCSQTPAPVRPERQCVRQTLCLDSGHIPHVMQSFRKVGVFFLLRFVAGAGVDAQRRRSLRNESQINVQHPQETPYQQS